MEVLSENEIERSLASSELTVGQFVQPRILECSPSDTLISVATRMSEAACSSIIVMDAGRAVGIWTERDALALDLNHPAVLDQAVCEVMSTPVRSVLADASMQEVASRFVEDGVRHFLVVDENDSALGVVSQTDVVLNQGLEHYLRLRNVDAVLNDAAPIIAASESLGHGVRLMRERRADAMLVHYQDDEYGILTERDVVRLLARRALNVTVGEVASRPLLCVGDDCSLYRARSMLVENRVRHIGVRDPQGALRGLISFSDILFGMERIYVQELRQALSERDDALRLSRHNLRLAEKVIESSLDGIMITNAQGVIESVNPAFSRLTGYSPEEVLGKTPAVLASGRHDPDFYAHMWQQIDELGHWQGEVWNRRKNGEIYPELLTIASIRDDTGTLTHYAALFSDITELKENEEQIRNLAYYDPLTQLPNRRLFADRLGMAMAHAHRSHGALAVMFVDLDRFKRINDSLGHAVGDQLLQTVAQRLIVAVREDDTVARMGGDEFIVLLSEVDGLEPIAQVARRVIESMTKPMTIQGREMVVTCSLGISVYPEDGSTPEELIQNADTAMYRAKDAGRNSYQLYSPQMNARSLEHLSMEVCLRKALEVGDLQVYLQPLVRADDELVVGAEALLRWQHERMGWVSPADFIPLAEETGLIVAIGEFVLEQACAQLAQWQRQGRRRISISVNISARHFHSRDFLSGMQALIARHGISPQNLVLELTESMLVDDAMENIRAMNALREMGIRLAIDDFGTGYSSLSYLRRFPIHSLKVDRSFIRGIAQDNDDAAIVKAVIQLAHSLGLSVVAEGVEDAEQLARLREFGCELIQGFYYGPAISMTAFSETWLKA